MEGDWPRPDWRDAGAYAPLLAADRPLLAFEWLRRDPAYRADARRARRGVGGSCPGRWGLHRFEPAEHAVPRARPLWTAACHPLVLGVAAEGAGERGGERERERRQERERERGAAAEEAGDTADMFDLARWEPLATLAVGPAGEHLLLSDGLRCLRLDIGHGTLRAGPVRLCYRLGGFAAAERPLLTLRRLIALGRDGRFSAALHPRDVRARRHVLALRAHDAAAQGASQREIAAWLLDGDAAAPRWRVQAPSLRGRVQRLARGARLMAAGGYRDLLA